MQLHRAPSAEPRAKGRPKEHSLIGREMVSQANTQGRGKTKKSSNLLLICGQTCMSPAPLLTLKKKGKEKEAMRQQMALVLETKKEDFVNTGGCLSRKGRSNRGRAGSFSSTPG